jgi:hypothetical protein
MRKKEEDDNRIRMSKLANFIYLLMLDHMQLSEVLELIEEAENLQSFDVTKHRALEKLYSISSSFARQLR